MSEVEFSRTAEAAANDRLSRWSLIEAIAADAVESELPITGVQSCVAAGVALTKAGSDYSTSTVKSLCVVAKFDHGSTMKQRKVWRRYGWTAISRIAHAGWSPEAAEELLDGERKTHDQIAAALNKPSTKKCAGSEPSFDDRCAAWVQHANKLMMDGARLAEEADTGAIVLSGHAELALTIYRRMTERQLDAEIRQLLDAADVR